MGPGVLDRDVKMEEEDDSNCFTCKTKRPGENWIACDAC